MSNPEMEPCERGYYLPPGWNRLAGYAGFYVESSAVYTPGLTAEKAWERFEASLCDAIERTEQGYVRRLDWLPSRYGQSRYTLLQKKDAQVIAEEMEAYIAVYIIVPENCPAPKLACMHLSRRINRLRKILLRLYPGHVMKRRDSWNMEPVE